MALVSDSDIADFRHHEASDHPALQARLGPDGQHAGGSQRADPSVFAGCSMLRCSMPGTEAAAPDVITVGASSRSTDTAATPQLIHHLAQLRQVSARPVSRRVSTDTGQRPQ